MHPELKSGRNGGVGDRCVHEVGNIATRECWLRCFSVQLEKFGLESELKLELDIVGGMMSVRI